MRKRMLIPAFIVMALGSYTLINLAKKLEKSDSKSHTEVIPRYTHPLVVEWVNKTYNTNLKTPVHTCGAGITFGYLNQRGELFPCDRITHEYEKCPFAHKIIPKSLLDFDFIEIWDSWEFNKAFELQVDEKIHKNYFPCATCAHLRKDCFPCPVYYQEGRILMDDCFQIWRQTNEEN